MMALNDLWTLDVSGSWAPPGPNAKSHVNGKSYGGGNGDSKNSARWGWRWEEVHTKGKKPFPRGYHTANLVGHVMVVIGGSDGKECFSDIWVLNLGESFRSLLMYADHLTCI